MINKYRKNQYDAIADKAQEVEDKK